MLWNEWFIQPGARGVQRGQFRSEQVLYSIFVNKLPIIMSSSTFRMTGAQCLWREDADWLLVNIIEVPVPVGGKWWY